MAQSRAEYLWKARERAKRYREAMTPEQKAAKRDYNRAYREKNKEKVAEYHRIYTDKNREEINARANNYLKKPLVRAKHNIHRKTGIPLSMIPPEIVQAEAARLAVVRLLPKMPHEERLRRAREYKKRYWSGMPPERRAEMKRRHKESCSRYRDKRRGSLAHSDPLT